MPENYTARWYKAESPANIPPAPSAMNEKDISKLYMWHVWRDEQYWKWKDMILLHWKGTQVEHNSFVLCSRLWRHESWPNKKALENAMSRVSHLQGSSPSHLDEHQCHPPSSTISRLDLQAAMQALWNTCWRSRWVCTLSKAHRAKERLKKSKVAVRQVSQSAGSQVVCGLLGAGFLGVSLCRLLPRLGRCNMETVLRRAKPSSQHHPSNRQSRESHITRIKNQWSCARD